MKGQYAVGSPTLARPAKVPYVCSGPGCSFVPPVSCRPLGQHHDTIRFRQLLCPDPSCDVCNSTTAEVNQLLFPEILEDATPSVSPSASIVPVTESSYSLSPAFSAVPPKDPIPALLPEPFPLPPPILSTEPATTLADFLSPSPPSHSLPPELFPALKPKIPVDNSPPQPLAVIPPPPHDTQRVDPVVHTEATSSLNTIFSLESPFPKISSPYQVHHRL